MRTALHWACECRSHRVIKLLLAWGSDVNAQDDDGHTPIFLMLNPKMYRQKVEVAQTLTTIKRLIQYGATLNIKDKSGKKATD